MLPGWLSATDTLLGLALSVATVVGAAWATTRRLAGRRRRRLSAGPGEQAAREALNRVFAGRARILGFPTGDPELVAASPTELACDDDRILARAAEVRPDLERRQSNEVHGLLANEPVWAGRPGLTYRTFDFATMVAMREVGHAFPPVISANALVCCAALGKVYLLDRGDTATFPHCLHIFGGNYRPVVEGVRGADSAGLRATATRELLEEIGHAPATLSASLRVAAMELSDDHSRDFVQLNYLGVNLDADHAEELGASEEGHIVSLSLDELGEVLLDDDRWVPAGQAMVLLWLARGAPTAGRGATFSARRACAVFDRWAAAHSD